MSRVQFFLLDSCCTPGGQKPCGQQNQASASSSRKRQDGQGWFLFGENVELEQTGEGGCIHGSHSQSISIGPYKQSSGSPSFRPKLLSKGSKSLPESLEEIFPVSCPVQLLQRPVITVCETPNASLTFGTGWSWHPPSLGAIKSKMVMTLR